MPNMIESPLIDHVVRIEPEEEGVRQTTDQPITYRIVCRTKDGNEYYLRMSQEALKELEDKIGVP